MYRNLGYYTESPAQVLLPAARLLVQKFSSNFDTVFSDAIREAGLSDRRYMKDLTRDDPIQISRSAAFPKDSEEFRALLHIIYSVMAASGWGDYRPQVLRYTEDPIMSLDDILCESLNEHVDKGLREVGQMWPEKCNIETFRTHLASIIKRLALLWEHRPYIVDKLERYIGDTLYRMKTMEIAPTALDQFDRTLLYYIVYSKNVKLTQYADSSGQRIKLLIGDAKDQDPLIAPEIARIRSVVQPGPWLRFARLLSNQEQRELAYTLSPVLPDLPLVTGYMIPVGPFYEMDLAVHSRITWGDAEQFSGFIEQVKYALPEKEVNTAQQLGFRIPVYRYGAKRKYNSLQEALVSLAKDTMIKPAFDWPTLEIINDTDDQGKPNLKYSWYSPTLQRMVHDASGANVNTLLLDLASTHKELGETPVVMQNIADVRFADLSKLPADRRIRTTSSADVEGDSAGEELENVSDAPVLRKRIYEDIWYFEGGKNLKLRKNVDVTPLYTRLGNVTFKPALSQYFSPSRNWFLQPDQTAIDYVVGRLELNVYDAKRSALAITISHNANVFKRITGRDAPFDAEEVIRAMHALPITK